MARRRLIPVAVMVQLHGYGRQVLRGVVNYVRQGAPWHFVKVDIERAAADPAIIEALKPRGIIAQLVSPAAVEWAGRFGGPIVNVSGVRATAFPRVGVDNVAVGAMAARHLIEKGYRHFACVCSGDILSVVDRERGFRLGIEGVGLSYRTLDRLVQPRPVSLAEQEHEAKTWLRSLPKPCGMFEACPLSLSPLAVRLADVRCPEDVGIVSIGDDVLDAETHMPPLTTVDYPGVQIGFEAAQLLDRLMKGARPPKEPLLFPPTGVTVRQSTNSLALADELVTNALKHIRANLAQPLSAAGVAAACAVSRRTLSRRLQHLGRSLTDEIRQARCEQACKLLAETDMPLKQVAARSGMKGVRQLFMLLRQTKGTTPSRYRLENATGARNKSERE